MRVVVFGASGKVGSLVVEQLVREGHRVVAYVHHAAPFESQSNLEIVKGDIYDAASVAAAVQRGDAVISVLGSWGTPRKDVLSSAMQNIIPAMEKGGIPRIISLTGADARAPGDHYGLIHRLSHFAIDIFAHKVLRDGERHIALLASSKLQWTIVRSPIMTSSRSQGYVLAGKRPLPWSVISREAIVSAVVDQLDSEDFVRQSPFISKA